MVVNAIHTLLQKAFENDQEGGVQNTMIDQHLNQNGNLLWVMLL